MSIQFVKLKYSKDTNHDYAKKSTRSDKQYAGGIFIDDLMDKLLLLNKIEIGLEQAKKGETYPSEEAKKMIKGWSSC